MPVNSIPETLLDASALTEKIDSLAHAMAEIVDDPDHAALVGIRTRGVTLARRIHSVFRKTRGWELPIGILDITLYRDDLSQIAAHPLVRKTDLDFDVQDKTILLIDDVIYTGRTIRSAIDQIIDFGRPRVVKLGVLVDRGRREYPIQPDFAAYTIETTPDQVVKVSLIEDDDQDMVILKVRGES